MSEATDAPTAAHPAAATAPAPAPPGAAPASETEAPRPRRRADVRTLLECGAHFGHQTRRWNPQMKPFLFGERNGIHIIDLDRTVPRFAAALEFVQELTAQGGKLLFVGTKRQAQAPVRIEAERAEQFYVNNRWLGGMLTNFRTVRKSIDRFKEQLALLADAEQVAELSKKELSRLNRSITKYRKSLDGIKEMRRLPDALFVIDLQKEHIAVSEARRLAIPIVAIVDSNCSPDGIDFPIPANDDAVRAIQLYCELVADACLDGARIHNERIVAEGSGESEAPKSEVPSSGRRVVEIKHPLGRRGRQAHGSHSAGGRRRSEEEAPEKPAGEAAATPAPPEPEKG